MNEENEKDLVLMLEDDDLGLRERLRGREVNQVREMGCLKPNS